MKDKLLESTRAHAKALNEMQKRVGRYAGRQIQADSILNAVQKLAASWFDDIRPMLEAVAFDPARIALGTEVFDRLLQLGKRRAGKSSLLGVLQESADLYKEVIHSIETTSFASPGTLSILPFVEGLSSDEGEYLDEAQRCLTVNGLRACVTLGWCATVARIHRKIEEIGFDKFNAATDAMVSKTTGRYKFYKKKYAVDSRSELQTVYDTDLLWVLEYLGLIDNNQHQRLRHCFDLRNNSAHPGQAPIKGPNLYSFYSDITEIVLKNDKFAINTQS